MVYLESVAELYTIVLGEHFQIALGMLLVGICSSHWSPKLTRVVQWCLNVVIVPVMENVDAHIHTLASSNLVQWVS
jgi:hypothetical protein